ncbi:unnamed protein product [Clonostachys rosea]|uniref:CBM-cenC domain-containing protein n=1 Tax=Bionectria ochroleuca TaxID=29856 RepID=A0ABY6UG62_BIOOC|nr:unnamed protein product [Clonostachys rosea]
MLPLSFAVLFAALAIAVAEDTLPPETSDSPCAAVTNLVPNGDFESSPDGAPWVFIDTGMTLLNDPALARSGSKAALSTIIGFDQRNRITQTFPTVRGKSYTFRFWWAINYGDPGVGNKGCYITTIVAGGLAYNDFPLVAAPLNTYAFHDYEFTAYADTTNLLTYIFCNQEVVSGLKVLLDDVGVYENLPGCPIPT